MNVYIENAHDIIHETSVDFVLRPCVKEVHIVQYDKSLPVIKVSLYKNGEHYVLPEDSDVRIRFGKLDHTFVYSHALGCNEDKTIVYFRIEPEMTVLAGRVSPVVEIYYDNKYACSSPIPVVITRNSIQDSDIESSSYSPIFIELQEEVADHEVRIQAIETLIVGDYVSLHGDQYNIDGKKGFTSDVSIASTGTLSLLYSPTANTHAVNKLYVDQAIEAVEMRSDVIDVLGTYDELENYDTSDVRLNDLIKVISDETHDDAISYYRWESVSDVNQWVYVASEGPFYTITQIDSFIDSINDDIEDVDERKLELHEFDGFVGGTQVHDQINNGELKYCQSGSQTEVDPSGSPLIQIRLSQSHVTSVSNRKALYIKQISITYETDDEPGVEKIWNYEITSRLFAHTSGGADIDPKTVTLVDPITDVSLDWNLTYMPSSGKQYYGSYDANKGQQFGSGSHPAEFIILQTTSLQNCTIKDVKVYVSGASNTQAKVLISAAEDQWDNDSVLDPTITSSNSEYEFTHGEEGTHLGSGSVIIIEYNHIFLKKEDGDITTIEPNEAYLYLLTGVANDNYRLYKYINLQMQEVSQTRLGTTSDTAYRGDYGQDNYNKLTAVRTQDYTFSGNKTFSNDVIILGTLLAKDGDDVIFKVESNGSIKSTYVYNGLNISTGDLFIGAGHLQINADGDSEQTYDHDDWDIEIRPDRLNFRTENNDFEIRFPYLDDGTTAVFATYVPIVHNTVLAGPSSTSASNALPTFRSLVSDDIPSLAASKITSGTFDSARIPSLAASKITSGVFNVNLIPTLTTDKIANLYTSQEAWDNRDDFLSDPTSYYICWQYYEGTLYGNCYTIASPPTNNSPSYGGLYALTIGDSGFIVDACYEGTIGNYGTPILHVKESSLILYNANSQNSQKIFEVTDSVIKHNNVSLKSAAFITSGYFNKARIPLEIWRHLMTFRIIFTPSDDYIVYDIDFIIDDPSDSNQTAARNWISTDVIKNNSWIRERLFTEISRQQKISFDGHGSNPVVYLYAFLDGSTDLKFSYYNILQEWGNSAYADVDDDDGVERIF